MKNLKGILILSLIIFIPLAAKASLDKNLYYGLQNDPQVIELQEFLTEQGVYSGPITGNFFSLTLKAVKQFQTQQDLPQTGYFGVLSRQKANDILTANTAEANQEAIQETGTTVPPVETPKTTNDVVNSLQNQVALLLQQLALLQSQMTTLNQIQQNTQQIAQNTCVQNWQCTAWTACENSQQTRTCTDLNNCGIATNKPSETQSCSSIPTKEDQSNMIKNYKIVFLGYRPYDVKDDGYPWLDGYIIELLIDTGVDVRNISLWADNTWLDSTKFTTHNYRPHETYFNGIVSKSGDYLCNIIITSNWGEEVVKGKLNTKITIPAMPVFENSENGHQAYYEWMRGQEDTRFSNCQAYRGKTYNNLGDCIKDINSK